MTARDALALYERNNFRVVMWPEALKQKGPIEKGWTDKTYKIADWHDGLSIGILTGTAIGPERHLNDVDIDRLHVRAAKALLPPTNFGFCRAGKSLSHAFYTTTRALPTRVFKALDGKTIVELRGTTDDGRIGFQTMAPPSLHPEHGVRIEFRDCGLIGHAEEEAIQRRVALYAGVCLLVPSLPEKSCGHEMRLALAGFLRGCEIPLKDAIAFVEVLTEETHNSTDEVDDDVTSTYERAAHGKRVTSGGALAKALGKPVVAHLREWLAPARALSAEGSLRVDGGQLTPLVDEAAAALLASPIPIYQRGGTLVRPVRSEAPGQDNPVRRAAGSIVLVQVKEAWLGEQMGVVREWSRGNARINVPPLYPRTLLARGEWPFPALRAILPAPTLTLDGRILDTPGFDAPTGLLLDFPVDAYPPVPLAPTQDDARAALVRLERPLRGFPFADAPAKATALAAILTALVRPSLRTAPMVGYDAPAAGTGKSMLAEIVGLVATGVRPPSLSQGKTEEEDEKRLQTVMFAGDSVLYLDNCERPIAGDFLCSLLTQEVVQARILGQSERRILPSTTVVLASGNNLTFAGDVSRRAVVCRLDANVEHPDKRKFDFDCHAEVQHDRAALVVAGLTILRAYAIAGSPETLTPMGSFSDWTWIRGALVWLGCADPADTRAGILDSDPKRDELVEVLGLWWSAFLDTPKEVSEIPQLADAGSTTASALRAKLTEVACRGVWSGKSVGWWLRRHKDRVAGGMRLRSESYANLGRQRWHVERVGESVAAVLPFEGGDDGCP